MYRQDINTVHEGNIDADTETDTQTHAAIPSP